MAPGVAPLPAYPQHHYQQQQPLSHHHRPTGLHSPSGQGVFNVASASVPLSRLHDARSPHDVRRPDLPMPHDASSTWRTVLGDSWGTVLAGAPPAVVHGSHAKRDLGQADLKLTPSAPKRIAGSDLGKFAVAIRSPDDVAHAPKTAEVLEAVPLGFPVGPVALVNFRCAPPYPGHVCR